MIVVTGGAGFVGSHVARALDVAGGPGVVVVDDLTDGDKHVNLADVSLADYLDRDEFASILDRDDAWLDRVTAVVHQGACTDTTVHDGRLMMAANFTTSKRVAMACARRAIPLVYASSAAVYGSGRTFREEAACERPANVYGFSKLAFDQWVRANTHMFQATVVGLRYFNVYGTNESHKGPMASMVWQLHRQIAEHGRARLFGASDGYGDGGQRRDFVCVDDVVDVIRWALATPNTHGIFNVGTGASRTFRELADAVIAFHGRGTIEYVPFPDALRGRYQPFTEADLTRLRAAGCTVPFRSLEQGVAETLGRL